MEVVSKRLPIDVQRFDDPIIERQELTADGEKFEFLRFQGAGTSTYGILLKDNEITKYKPKSLKDAKKAVKKYLTQNNHDE